MDVFDVIVKYERTCRYFPVDVPQLYGQHCKFIGRQENLADDLIAVLRQLNENFDEDYIRSRPRQNESKTSKEEVRWDPSLRQLMMQLELPGLVHFGYLSDADRKSLDIPAGLVLSPSPYLSSRPLPEKAGLKAA